MESHCLITIVIATLAIGLLDFGNGAQLRNNEISLEKTKPPTLPPCPEDCPVGVYKCQQIKLDLVLLNLLVATQQLPIKLSVNDIIYINCVLPDGGPIYKNTTEEVAVKGGGGNPPPPPPPCTTGCPGPWEYVCCKNNLITLKLGLGPIGPIPEIKNLILLCRGLNIDVTDVKP